MPAHRRLLPLALIALAGCQTGSPGPSLREATQSDAKDVLLDAQRLVPTQPPPSNATRMQSSEFPPITAPAPAPAPVTVSPPTGIQQTGLSAPKPTSGPPEVAVQILANVNGTPILDDELREAVAARLGEILRVPLDQRAALQDEVRRRELDKLIERELVLDEAFTKLKELKKAKIIDELRQAATKESDRRLRDIKLSLKAASDDELRAMLGQQGLSLAGMRRQIERNFMMMEYVRNVVGPTVKRLGLRELRDYYTEHADEFRVEDRVEWQDLFLDVNRFQTPEAARAFAEQLVQRMQKGEAFEKLSAEFDHGDSKLRGGLGLGSKRGEIRPAEMEPTVLSLDAGQVGPVVDVGFGLHVIRCKTRQRAGIAPFDAKTQSDIRRKLENVVGEREYRRLVDELRERHKESIAIYVR